MTVCKVLACENVKKSNKLLKFQLDDGSGTPRQILSGIATVSYTHLDNSNIVFHGIMPLSP